MPIPAYITFTVNGNDLKGSVTFPGKEDTSEAHEFSHQVRFIEQDWFSGKIVREHSPVMFIKPIDAVSITLYQLLTKGTFIDKVHIDWYRHNEKRNIEEVYFRHILEKAKICSIAMFMPNVKDSKYEQYPHLEKISLRYDHITWIVPTGNIRFTDRWHYAFLIQGMNITEQAEWDKISEQDAVTDSMDEEDDSAQEELKVLNPRWEHVDENKKQDSADKAAAGDTIKLIVDVQGYVTQGKITFDIYDVSKDTPQRLDSVSGKNEDGTASAEWTIEDPRRESETHELKLAFEGSARSKYSERCEIGYVEKIIGVIAVKVVDFTLSPIPEVQCVLSEEDKEWPEEITSENGDAVWENILLGDYTIKFTIDDKEFSKQVPWMNSDKHKHIVQYKKG